MADGLGLQGDQAQQPYSAAVVAGGQARRFAEDKACYPWRGRPLLAWVLESFPEPSERFVVASRDYSRFSVPVYPDCFPESSSANGVYSALHHAAQPWLAVAACDMPLLSACYWRLLLLARRSSVSVVIVADARGRLEPLAALYHRRIQSHFAAQLQQGQPAMQAMVHDAEAAGYGVQRLPRAYVQERCGAQVLHNINRKSDLRTLS